jgi:hypothetical protein
MVSFTNTTCMKQVYEGYRKCTDGWWIEHVFLATRCAWEAIWEVAITDVSEPNANIIIGNNYT